MRYRLAVTVLFALLAVTAFAENQPPTAEPQTVFTNGEPREIILRGADPEGKDLRFEIVKGPREGELSDPEPIVPEPEIDPRTGEPFKPPITSALVVYRPAGAPTPDTFTFSVTDVEDASGLAAVAIDPPPDEPPPPPVDTVIAHDTVAGVFKDTPTTLTLTGAAPEGVSLTFFLIENPRFGEVGELVQGTEEPRRTASLLYTPNREYTGDDEFSFKACGVIDQKEVCDDAIYRIEVSERPEEPRRLIADLHLTAKLDAPLSIDLGANDNRAPVEGERLVLQPFVAGGVADSDRDGQGDNHNELPGSEPVFMAAGLEQDNGPGATGTARMHFEFDIRELQGRGDTIVRADVLLNTHRRTEEGMTTFFYWSGSEGDGELAKSDFETEVERIPGAVMPIPPQMRVGEEGTFTFSAIGPVKDSLEQGFGVLTVQGRVNEKGKGADTGLEVRTSADENIASERQPLLVVETSQAPLPLTYSVRSLPEFGILKDSRGNEIRDVPYTLPDHVLVYVGNDLGQVSFEIAATDGFFIDVANAIINIIRARCQFDRDACDDGR